nr:GAF domain-containing protein [Deltaproteobacteria bacterium]
VPSSVVAVVETQLTDPNTILRLLPHGVIVVAHDWRIAFANPEAIRMLGEAGETLWARCPDLEQTAFANAFRYAMADRTELLTESALPTVGWCQARARPTPDGGLLITLRQVQAHSLETGQAKQALLVGEIGDALTREDSLHGALQRCAAAIVRNLDATLARIWVLDQSGDLLELSASAGADKQLAGHQAQLRVGQDKVGQIAEDLSPYLTNDVPTDKLVGDTEWSRREKIASFAGYPLRIEDRVLGVMAMHSRKLLDHDLLNSLSTIADAIALGIARKTSDAARRRAEALLRIHAERLEVLHDLGKELSAELDVTILVQKVIDTATRLSGAQFGAFFYHLPSDGNQILTYYALSGVSREAFARFPLPRMTALLSPAFGGDRAVRVDDIHSHEAYGKTGPHFGVPPGHVPVTSFLAVPVRGHNGRRIGALLFGHKEPNAFSVETEKLVTGIASTAAIAIENARLFKEAHDLIVKLEKSNAELDQFAYVASHDLKAPLRGIANLAEWIEDDLGERMDDQAREHMNLLKGRVIRLENLIGGILAYSRAGRDGGDSTPIALAALTREVWELLAPPETAHLTLAGTFPTIEASRVQLQQVLMNLIGNALKYNQGRDLHIEVGVRRDGDRWVIWVKDDGIGIAPEFQDRIWGLFQTLERRDKIESTGIGLSVVRKIIEAHKGRTWVESELGAGATFYFTWPAGSEGDKLHG